MSKKSCLNFLVSVSIQEPIGLSRLKTWAQVSSELRLKPSLEIIGEFYLELEKKALQAEVHSVCEGFVLWLRSLAIKLAGLRGNSDKV